MRLFEVNHPDARLESNMTMGSQSVDDLGKSGFKSLLIVNPDLSEFEVENVVDLSIVVDEEKGAADELVGGEERRTSATVLDQLQSVQIHVLVRSTEVMDVRYGFKMSLKCVNDVKNKT